MKKSSPAVWAVCAVVLLGRVSGQEIKSEISRTPPPEYADSLKPLLTAFEAVNKLPPAPKDEKGDGSTETLLDEEIISLQPDGRFIEAIHSVKKVLGEAGVEHLGKDEVTFLRSREKIHVALARTIRPDGRIIEAEEKAMFLKRTGPDEGAMHTDRDTLHVVFPEVAIGSVVELVIVREVQVPTIEGEFTFFQPAGDLGGIRRQRVVLDVPGELLQRMKWGGLGFTLPEPSKVELPNGKKRLTWQMERLRPLDFEVGGPPLAQVGPVWRITTISSWDAIGTWFANLTKETEGSSALPGSTAKEWAGEGGTPEQVVRKLYEGVCNQVRYTGLEFGKGSHQPRSPESVLATRYGDCKDKANLLRVLLREQGIESAVALLDARHAGAIDKKYPTPGGFNHAILAVKLPGTKDFTFCDPTLEGVPFGMLGPGDANREVLLVHSDGRTEWVRTPSQSQGTLDLTANLELEPGGGFSGWLTARVKGYLGFVMANGLTKSSRRDALNSLARIYIGNVEATSVVDYSLLKGTETSEWSMEVRMYVVKEGSNLSSGGGNERAVFPMISALVPRVGRAALRTTTFQGMVVESRVHGEYRLPAQWLVLDKPADFKRAPAGASFSAKWSSSDGLLKFEGSMATRDDVIGPEKHQALWSARRDLLAWAGNPVLLKTAAEPLPEKVEPIELSDDHSTKRWAPPADGLPKLITAQGQLALVDKRFPFDPNNPFDADHAARKIAMQKAAEYFPDDPAAQFQAGLMIVLSDLLEGETENLVPRAKELIDKYADQVSADFLSAGKLMLATSLAATKKEDEALPLAIAAADGDGPPQIRKAGAILAAHLLLDRDANRSESYARAALEDGMLLPVPAFGEVAGTLITALARKKDGTSESLAAEWNALAARYGPRIPALRELLLDVLSAAIDEGKIPMAERVAEAASGILEAAGGTEEEQENLKGCRTRIDLVKSYEPIQKEVASLIRASKWPDLDKLEPDDKLETVSDCTDAIGDVESREVMFRYALRRLTHYGAQPDMVDHLAEAVEIANLWLGKPSKGESGPPSPEVLESLIDDLLRHAQRTAKGTGKWKAAALLEGEVINRRSGSATAIAHYRKLAAAEDSSKELRADAHAAAAALLYAAGDKQGVLREWHAMESDVDEEDRPDLEIRLIYLTLLEGKQEEVWPAVEKFVVSEDEVFSGAEKCKTLLTAMMKDRASAEAWWKRSRSWWPKWEALSKALSLDVEESELSNPWDTWDSRSEKLPNLAKKSDGEGDANEMDGASVQNVLVRARWHRECAKDAIALLRGYVAKAHPDQSRVVEELVKALGGK